MPRSDREVAVEQTIERFALEPLSDQRVKRITMGQRAGSPDDGSPASTPAPAARRARTSLDPAGIDVLIDTLAGLPPQAGHWSGASPRPTTSFIPTELFPCRANSSPGDDGDGIRDTAVAVLKRDIIVFRSYRLRFLGAALSSFASVAVIYYVSRLVSVPPFENPDQYFAFAVVGLMIAETSSRL